MYIPLINEYIQLASNIALLTYLNYAVVSTKIKKVEMLLQQCPT